MCKTKLKTAIMCILAGMFFSSNAFAMSLEEYLNLVKKDSLAFKANDEKVQGSELMLSQADLSYIPEFFVDATYLDSSQPQNPAFFNAVKRTNLSLGVSQVFKFGLEAKLMYETLGNNMTLDPSMAGFPIQPEIWDAAPKLKLKMPFLSNGFGRTLRAQEESIRKQIIAEQEKAEAESAVLLAEAEANYWKLAIWQDVIGIQERALNAAQNILNYVTKKQKMNLGEDSDVIQAQALVESKSFELTMTNNEFRSAKRAFNKMVNRNANEEVGELQKIDYERLSSFDIPETRPGDRADIRALQAQADLAVANMKLVREKGKPTLDIISEIAMHGQRTTFSDAMDQSLQNKFNSTMVGVNLKVPLFFGSLSDLQKGALKSQQAAELNKDYAVFNQEQEWVNLVESLKDIRENLRMLSKLESIQKKKLDIERRRFKEGKTTTFQVLSFEQDYSQASASRAKLASEILGLLTQIQLYQPVKGN